MATDPAGREAGSAGRLRSAKTVGGILIVPTIAVGVLAMAFGRAGVWERIFGPLERRPVDFPSLVLRNTPNRYLVCPPDYCASPADEQSKTYPLSADALREGWFRMVEKQPRVALVSSDREQGQYDFEARTPVLNFPDTVTVRFIPLSQGSSTLAIYSRSHYGYSDLGVNRRRVTAWLALLDELLPSAAKSE